MADSRARPQYDFFSLDRERLIPFSVFNAMVAHPELMLEVSKHFSVDTLVSLYAISKEFHLIANRRFTAMILGQSVSKAAESSRTFIHRCYRNLCMRDPAARPHESKQGEARWVPTFRWLRMVFFRERVVDDIIRELWLEGHRLPQRASLVVKKLWFALDISDNDRRIGLFHNESMWTSSDLFVATLFFVKLDMRLTDPVTGNGEIGLRRLLLNQRSLSTLAKVLRRDELKNQVDLLRMIAQYNYTPLRRPKDSILGLPPHAVGQMQYEGWGLDKERFTPIDILVAREAVRRNLHLQNYYIDMMLYGYINKRTWEDIWTPVPQPMDSDGSDEDGQGETEDGESGGHGIAKFTFTDPSDEEAEEQDEEEQKEEEEEKLEERWVTEAEEIDDTDDDTDDDEDKEDEEQGGRGLDGEFDSDSGGQEWYG